MKPTGFLKDHGLTQIKVITEKTRAVFSKLQLTFANGS